VKSKVSKYTPTPGIYRAYDDVEGFFGQKDIAIFRSIFTKMFLRYSGPSFVLTSTYVFILYDIRRRRGLL
jgi:hypothetical protein